MPDKSNNSKKQKSNKKTILIAGLIWLGLGFFGLIFDPTKNLIIISQFIAGIIFLLYYFYLKLK
jgi:hypothetical protein